jgi:hypothetical protein
MQYEQQRSRCILFKQNHRHTTSINSYALVGKAIHQKYHHAPALCSAMHCIFLAGKKEINSVISNTN